MEIGVEKGVEVVNEREKRMERRKEEKGAYGERMCRGKARMRERDQGRRKESERGRS